VKYVFITALIVMLLFASVSAAPDVVVSDIQMSATGGAIIQIASNNAAVAGDDAVMSESISMTAVGTGVVVQDAENVGAVTNGDGAIVDQSVTMSAEGSTVIQNPDGGNVNTLVGNGDGASVDQETTMEASATNGPVVQQATNNAAWVGNDVSMDQTQNLAGEATGGPVVQTGINAATVFGDNAQIYENISAAAVATGDIAQVFNNAGFGTGAGARYTQVIMGGANSTGGSILQFGGNDANLGLTQNRVRSNQSVIFTGIADQNILQIGGNTVNAGNNAVIGQEVQIGAEGDTIVQIGGNLGTAGNNFVANQAVIENATSSAGSTTFQFAGNLFIDTGAGSETDSALGQLISGGSRGGANAVQIFANLGTLNRLPFGGNEEYHYDVTQINIGDARASNGVLQIQPNIVLWETAATGGWAPMVNGNAVAPNVLQLHPNILIPV